MFNALQAIQAGQMGEQAREKREYKNALALAGESFGSGDYKGAANALLPHDINAGLSVMGYADKQQQAALEKQKADQRAQDEQVYNLTREFLNRPESERLAFGQQVATQLGIDMPTAEELSDTFLTQQEAAYRVKLGQAAPQAETIEPKWEEVTIQTANGPVVKMYDANSRDPMSTLMDVGAAVPKTPLSQVNVNTGSPGDNRPLTDKPSKDFQRVWDEQSQSYRDEVIPGTATARERELLNSKAFQSLQANQEQFDAIMTNIEAADELIGPFTAGAGSYLQVIRGTPARDLEARLETVKANIGFDKLNEMRQTSPTGGALGQVTERELKFLQSVRGSIDEQQSPAQLRQTLQEIRESLLRLKEVRDIAFKLEQQNAGEGQIVSTDPLQSSDLPDGFALQGEDSDLLEFMTPEERALFAGGGQ